MKSLSAKGVATKEKILRTADELFYLHGYNATGLDAIIGSAGVTKGNFYYYFKSKEALAVDTLDWHFDTTKAEIQASLATKKIGPRDTLFAVLDVIRDRQQRQNEAGHLSGCFFGNFTLELSTNSSKVREKLDSIFSHYRKTFAELITLAQQQGEVSPHLDPAKEAQMVLSLVEGALLLDKARQAPQALDDAISFLKTHLST
ncbi:MAG: TetR/AcrR family transcriptional regulator [bacterium]